MTNKEFRALLDLFMMSDPWPLTQAANDIVQGILDREAKARGLTDWIDAYHKVTS